MHGVLMSAAFAILYPIGAVSIRSFSFKGLIWFHAGWMVFTYLIVLAGTAFGVDLARKRDVFGSSHVIIGLVVIASLLLQPITGFLHHRIYKTKGSRSGTTRAHIWLGRTVLTLGITTGGTGLNLAGTPNSGKIVYGVLAGVTWLTWITVVAFDFSKKAKGVKGGSSSMYQLRARPNILSSPRSGAEEA